MSERQPAGRLLAAGGAPLAFDGLHGNVLEAIFEQLERGTLQSLKATSHAWRTAARHTLCSPHWQAAHLSLPQMLAEQVSDAVLCARLAAHPHEARASNSCLEQLALHQAARCRPSFVLTLLRAYPAAASARDLNGMLPLHHAAMARAPTFVILALLRAFPEGARVAPS